MTEPVLQKPHIKRKWERIVVDIPVTITTVLESGEGTIVDLSEHGLQITGYSLPKGTQFQVEYEGQTVYGVVAWSEYDRFGARLPFAMKDGPLYDRLTRSRVEHGMARTPHPAEMPAFVGRPSVAGFGRRRG
jgi:PilZ domain